MKRLKLKAKKENKPSTIIKKEDSNPKSIQQLIFEDVKNINKFNILIEEFILALQNSDVKILRNISGVIIEIYEYFLIKNKSLISADLKKFLGEKLNIVLKVYLDVILPEEELDAILLKTIFKDLQRFLKFSDEEQTNSTLDSLVDTLLLNEELTDSETIKIFSSSFYLNKSKTNFEIILTFLYSKLNANKDLPSETLFNIYNFIIALGQLTEANLKSLYQNIIVNLVNNSTLPKVILVNLLTSLNKVIFDNLENPLIFSDYLINIYEKSSNEEFDIKVLSLSGLFILLTKYKLDYSNYYNMLYKTISMKYIDAFGVKTVFDSKNQNRLFKILELSLKSTTVPILVVLSFIKKLARICLVSSPNIIAIILGIIQNIIKLHPRAVILLIRNRKKNKTFNGSREMDQKIKENSHFNWNTLSVDKEGELNNTEEGVNIVTDDIRNDNIDDLSYSHFAKYEQFDDEELDTYKTNANMSCLWELYTLKDHFSFKIRILVNKFEKNFLKSKEFDLNSISNIKEQDLLYDLQENSHFYVTNAEDSKDASTENNNFNLII